MRLPELDEMAVEVHPLPISLLVTDGGGAGGDVNWDLLEISMVGCNRLERVGDPHDVLCFGPEYRLLEFCCVRQVD